MGANYIYTGCFFDFSTLQAAVATFAPRRLEQPVWVPHVTFAYRPKQVDARLFGREVIVRVIGYGNDGRNEGLRVEILSDDPVLETLAQAIPVPHITLSVAREGRAVDTALLTFVPVEPFCLTGRFGGWHPDKGVVLMR